MAGNIGQFVLDTLRAQLLDGSLPGQRINEAEIAQHLGVSRTPVRSALHVLASEGLLDYVPNSGFSIKKINPHFVAGFYEVRAVLEGLAAQLAAERGPSDDERNEMHRILRQLDRLIENHRGEPQTIVDIRNLNNDFHQAIFVAARNEHMFGYLKRSRGIPQINQLKNDAYDFDFVARAHHEHVYIFDAICNRQPARAEALSREHVFRGAEHMLAFLRDGSGERDRKLA